MKHWKSTLLAPIRGLANRLLARHPLELSRDELQRAVDVQFPVTVDAVVPVILENPSLRLEEGCDRIGLELTVRVEATEQIILQSRWLVQGEIDYDHGEFYFHNPDLISLDPGTLSRLLNAPGLIRRFVMEDVLGSLMSELPIYRLKLSHPKQALARRLLQKIQVRNGKLRVQLKVPEANTPEDRTAELD